MVLVHVGHHVLNMASEETAYPDHVVLLNFGYHVHDADLEVTAYLDDVILVHTHDITSKIVC